MSVWFDADGAPHLGAVQADFKVTWPDGKGTPLGLNQQRRSHAAVLYTPTYGPTTHARGGREYILAKDGDGAWLPLKAGQTYRARVIEIRDEGDSPLKTDGLVLSLGPQLVASLPECKGSNFPESSEKRGAPLKWREASLAGGAIAANRSP